MVAEEITKKKKNMATKMKRKLSKNVGLGLNSFDFKLKFMIKKVIHQNQTF